MKSRLGHETPTIIELNHIFYLTFRSYQKSIIKISVEGLKKGRETSQRLNLIAKYPLQIFPD